jgi:hypothetical protein
VFTGRLFFERLLIGDPGCALAFDHCTFAYIHVTNENGGAINAVNEIVGIEILDSTFYKCSVVNSLTGSTLCGGAAYLVSAFIDIGRTCASDCSAEYGQAFYFGEGCNQPYLYWINSINCSFAGDDDAKTGTITCGNTVGLVLMSGNFTECHVGPSDADGTRYGSAICLFGNPINPGYDANGRISTTLITDCGGLTSIDIIALTAEPAYTISYSAFYYNRWDVCDIRISNGAVTVTFWRMTRTDRLYL